MNTCSKVTVYRHRHLPAAIVAIGMLATLSASGPASAVPAAQSGGANPEFNINAADFPEDDAVILQWDQYWSLDDDGAVRRRDHRWVKILDSRAIGRYADQRIDFDTATDRLIVHGARTYLMDGTILPVPDYSINVAAPRDVAGWPDYSDWQQRIISFSGIEDGCVLELDYEIVTLPGVLPWISADLRLQADDSTIRRSVTVEVPRSTEVLWLTDNWPMDQDARLRPIGDGRAEYKCLFLRLTGVPNEPQSRPWQERCARAGFTTAGGAEEFCREYLGRVEDAASSHDLITEFAKEVTKDKLTPRDQLEALAGKLRSTFNYVASEKTMRSLRCRDAGEVFTTNYGNPLEAGALLVACCRAIGLEAEPALAVDRRTWDRSVPTDSAFAGIVAVVESDAGEIYAHPQTGVFTNPGNWGHHLLLSLSETGKLLENHIAARGWKGKSRLDMVGRVTLDKDGQATGELKLNLTGGFFDPATLDTSGAQNAIARRLVGRLLDGFEITDCSVTGLSRDEFSSSVQIKTDKALPQLQQARLLSLGDGPVALSSYPLPLGRSQRRTDVQLNGAFAEHVDLTIVLPEGASPMAIPASLPEASGDWGRVAQVTTNDDGTVRVVRDLVVNDDVLGPSDFLTIRQAVNSMRSTRCRYLLFGK